MASKVGVPTSAVAIGWVAAQPGVTAVIAGAKRPEQVEQNVRAAELVDKAKGILIGAAVVVTAMMLSIDAKFWGVVVMGGAVIILFFLPWLDNGAVKSIRYRPGWNKALYGVFVVNFVVLAYLGVQPPSPIGERVSQVGTLFYFGFFILMPWWSRLGEAKPVPARVTFAAH
mgnify:CR=1 FL=1